MSVKNKGSWCEKHNQYARLKFDCPYCELDELRERYNALVEAVAWMLECDAEQRSMLQEGFHPKRFHKDRHTEFIMTLRAARAEVDRLIANESAADCEGEG